MVTPRENSCLRYCKSTIFQANHNQAVVDNFVGGVVCDTAKVRFFKQITTIQYNRARATLLFAILQKYDFSSKSQLDWRLTQSLTCCLRYCKSTIFQANHNFWQIWGFGGLLFAILQKYDFSSKSQLQPPPSNTNIGCLRYCKSTIFQANHNYKPRRHLDKTVVCDTAKVRFFKQITTSNACCWRRTALFAILQKYDFSSKSQPNIGGSIKPPRCLRYCKSTIFQANHN